METLRMSEKPRGHGVEKKPCHGAMAESPDEEEIYSVARSIHRNDDPHSPSL